jgi:hypothetical protein
MNSFINENIDLFNEGQLSLMESITLAYEIACYIGYSDGCKDVRPSEEYSNIADEVWMFIDGLYQKRVLKFINGECSLQDFISFNVQEEEEKLKSYINSFYQTLKKLEKPE